MVRLLFLNHLLFDELLGNLVAERFGLFDVDLFVNFEISFNENGLFFDGLFGNFLFDYFLDGFFDDFLFDYLLDGLIDD